MQDRYAGDVGDFGKFKLLQELQREGFTLGVNWYRAGLLDEGQTVYYDETVPLQGREAWHQKAVEKLSLCDLIFLDPDNGLEPKRTTRARLVKYVRKTELEDYLAQGQNVALYQHRPRKKEELWFRQLRMKLAGLSSAQGKQVFALTCCRGTLRDYLIIAATAEDAAGIRQALQRIVQSPWGTTGFCRQSAFPDLDSVERKENPDLSGPGGRWMGKGKHRLAAPAACQRPESPPRRNFTIRFSFLNGNRV